MLPWPAALQAPARGQLPSRGVAIPASVLLHALLAAVVVIASGCAALPATRQQQGQEQPGSFSAALARALPSSIGVYGVHRRSPQDVDEVAVGPPAEPREGLPWTDREVSARIGAGFFISSDGLAVTAAHVVHDAWRVIVKLSDRRVFVAEVVGTDRDADIALIRIPVTLGAEPALGTSLAVWPGDWVLALGEPYGLDRSVTAGVVGARSRHFAEDGALVFIQTDLSLNPGNSGGPLVDTRGLIVGMNLRTVVGVYGGPGLSLAVPIEVVRQIASEIATHGAVLRPKLGAGFEDVTPFAAVAHGRPYASGALINDVSPGGIAAQMGLRRGDIVVGMNSRPIEDSADFARALLRWRSAAGTRITVFRAGAYRQLPEKVSD